MTTRQAHVLHGVALRIAGAVPRREENGVENGDGDADESGDGDGESGGERPPALGLDLVVEGRLAGGLKQLLSAEAWDYLVAEAGNSPPTAFSRADWTNFVTLVLEGEQSSLTDAGHRQLLRRLIVSGLADSGPAAQRDAALAMQAIAQ